MAPAKIAMITSFPAFAGLPPEVIKPSHRNRGHASSWVQALCGALGEIDGIDIHVFSLTRAVTQAVSGQTAFKVTYVPHRFPARFDPLHAFYINYLELKPYLQEYQPDLVHAFGLETGNGTIATYYKKSIRSCFIQGIEEYLSAYRVNFPYYRRIIMPFLEQRSLQRMNGVVVESDFAANWVDLRYPDIPKAIIPHAVSSDFLNAGISECKGMQVLCVGSFLPQKGHDTVLKALALCRNQSIHLCLVGAGVLRDEYERLIHGLKLDHRVVFAGVLSREQIISKMKQSFCLVMPSRMDTSPNVVTEAQAMGLPVIGSRAGGIPDLISEGIDGFLFDVDNEVELAECLDRLSGDSGKCRDLGQRGRQRVVDKHHPDVVARQHAGFFRSLVNAK